MFVHLAYFEKNGFKIAMVDNIQGHAMKKNIFLQIYEVCINVIFIQHKGAVNNYFLRIKTSQILQKVHTQYLRNKPSCIEMVG